MSVVGLAISSPLKARGASLLWLPCAPIAALAVLGVSQESISQVIQLMELGFLVISVINPVWVLAALLLSELTIRNFHFELIFAVIVLLPYLLDNAAIGSRGRSLVFAAAAFFVTAVLANIIATKDYTNTIVFLRSVGIGFITLILIPLAIRSREDFIAIGSIALLVALASASVALLQQATQSTVIQLLPPSPGVVGFEGWDGRSMGLTENPVRLSNDLMLFLFPVAGLLLSMRASPKSNLWLGALLIVFGLALYFTLTRSWAYSAVGATAAMALILRGHIQKEFFLLLLIVGGVFWYFAASAPTRYTQGPSSDDSAAARPVLWSAALNIALDNPISGIGYDKFTTISPQYSATISRDLLERKNAGSVLGRYDPHNDYLNVWASFGTFALLIYLAMLALTWSNFFWAARTFTDPLLRGVAFGGLGALAAFGVNTFFHNFFMTTLTFWILAGLSIALCKLVSIDASKDDTKEALAV